MLYVVSVVPFLFTPTSAGNLPGVAKTLSPNKAVLRKLMLSSVTLHSNHLLAREALKP